MLLGEHAVLDGGNALVCAIDQRIEVILSPRFDLTIDIISSLGRYETCITHIDVAPPFQFVLETIKHYQPHLTQGFTLTITSGFSEKLGLGSSAAVTVATLSALLRFLNKFVDHSDLIKQATRIIQSVQGLGSGADVAASVLGGMVDYRQTPFHAEKLLFTYPITLVYSGFKTPTPIVVNQVRALFSKNLDDFEKIKKEINLCAVNGIQMARDNNPTELGQAMTAQQHWMNALGVNTPLLQSIVDELQSNTEIKGAKISGSGLGDCIVGLGRMTKSEWLACHPERSEGSCSNEEILRFAKDDNMGTYIAVQMTTQGVMCE